MSYTLAALSKDLTHAYNSSNLCSNTACIISTLFLPSAVMRAEEQRRWVPQNKWGKSDKTCAGTLIAFNFRPMAAQRITAHFFQQIKE